MHHGRLPPDGPGQAPARPQTRCPSCSSPPRTRRHWRSLCPACAARVFCRAAPVDRACGRCASASARFTACRTRTGALHALGAALPPQHKCGLRLLRYAVTRQEGTSTAARSARCAPTATCLQASLHTVQWPQKGCSQVMGESHDTFSSAGSPMQCSAVQGVGHVPGRTQGWPVLRLNLCGAHRRRQGTVASRRW